MSRSPRTLRIRADRLHWDGTADIALRYPAAFGRVEILVDTLRVDGWVRLPGRDLTIHARRILARPADGRMAVIDVSGAPAEPSFDPQAPASRPRGRPAAPDGQAGQDGGAGRAGGRLSIVVDRIDGELGLAANGSAGGDAERGSDGVKPARPDGADGQFVNLAAYEGWGRRGRHAGSRVLEPWVQRSTQPYVVLAAGVAGAPARRGGDAGMSGSPGRGGDGGRIELRHGGAAPAQLHTTAAAGPPGRAAPAGTPGAPGDPGRGGRHRLYAVSVGSWGRWVPHEAFVGEGGDPLLAAMARKHRLPRRAQGGTGASEGGRVPAAPVAATGRDGMVAVAPATPDEIAEAFDLPFLRLVLARADADGAAGAADEANARYRWLTRVAAATDDAGARAIAEAADQALRAGAAAATY